MRYFVTGASGFIGSAIVPELISAGHTVLGLARSDESAAKLTAAGAEMHRGSLNDIESLKSGAANSDGVIHAGFIHDFTDYAASLATDRAAISAMGEVLAGTGKPLVVTSGTAVIGSGKTATEDKKFDSDAAGGLRGQSEEIALALKESDVRSSVVRLPPSVHGEDDLHGFVPMLIKIAREKGVAGYVGDGQNRWPAVHRLDAARLFRLAAESGKAGSRYHGIGDTGVPTREIAELIGKHLNLPVESIEPAEVANHFGWLGHFFAIDNPASSEITQSELDWKPTHPDLVDDLKAGFYFEK